MLSGQILESDIPRWLEIFAIGSDNTGSILIEGDALEATGTSETLTFTSKKQDYVNGVPTGNVLLTSLTDTTKKWKTDQWKGYYISTQ